MKKRNKILITILIVSTLLLSTAISTTAIVPANNNDEPSLTGARSPSTNLKTTPTEPEEKTPEPPEEQDTDDTESEEKEEKEEQQDNKDTGNNKEGEEEKESEEQPSETPSQEPTPPPTTAPSQPSVSNTKPKPSKKHTVSNVDPHVYPPSVVYVDDDYTAGGVNEGHTWGYDAFDTIKDAIPVVKSGGQIKVNKGEYVSPLYIEKPLSLVGEDKEMTVIRTGPVVSAAHPNGIIIKGTHDVEVIGFTLLENRVNIHVFSSSDVIIADVIISEYLPMNACSSENIGIKIESSTHVVVKYSRIFSKQIAIILMDKTSDCLLTQNVIEQINCDSVLTTAAVEPGPDSPWFSVGVKCDASTRGNQIYHNTFMDNSLHAYDVGDNIWDNGYPSGGNYWDDYKGSDDFHGVDQDIAGSDGIGDTPYLIPDCLTIACAHAVVNNLDHYPFTEKDGWLNQPPYIPYNPSPEDTERNVDLDAQLKWSGGDPDLYDTVEYDVYFGTSTPLSKVDTIHPVSVIPVDLNETYNPGGLAYGTTYYWKIVARDNHDATSESPIWEFTTKSKSGKTGGGGSSNTAPVADASAGAPYVGFVDQALTFDGSASYDPDGSLIEYTWDFGDDSQGSGEITNHVYASAGTYTVVLTVKDNKGKTATDTVEADISLNPNYPPSAPSLVGPVFGHRNKEYEFEFMSEDQDGDDVRYYLDWDDGTQSTSALHIQGHEIRTTHSWSQPGIYKVGVYAEDTAKAVSDVTYRTVFIDMIYVKDIGYLKNTEGDAIFDEFYSNETGNNSNLLYQNNDKYLLDTTGDGSWNYIYEVPTDTLVAYQEDMTAHIIIALLVLLGIAVFYYIIKTEKYKNLKLSKRLVIRTHGSK